MVGAAPAASGAGSRRTSRPESQVLTRVWREWWWLVLAVLAVAALVLGVAGGRGGMLERIYASLQLFILDFSQTPGEPVSTELQIARFLAPAVFGYATLRAVFALFDERLQVLRARFYRNHVVVCGLGPHGAMLVKGFAASGRVVAVAEDAAQPLARECRDAGALVVAGDPREREALRRAGLVRAEYLVAVGADDGANAQVAALALELCARRHGRPLHAFVHLSDPNLCSFLLERTLGAEKVRLEFFNVYERAARILLDYHSPLDVAAPHILVAGAGRLGQALIARAAWEWHERRAAQPELERLRVTVIDRDAESRARQLRRRYPGLERACDLQQHAFDADSPEFDRLAEIDPELVRSPDVAYVLFGDETRAVSATLSLADQARAPFRIVVRLLDAEGGLATLLRRGTGPGAPPIVVFSLASAYEPARVLEGVRGLLARSIHEEYLASHAQATNGAPYAQPWADLSPEGRERNLRQADALKQQLETVGYRLGPLLDWTAPSIDLAPAEVNRMARMEHERWLAERQEEGWTYGERRDEAARRHPALRPWEALPEEVRDVNRELVRTRPAVLARAGIQVYRA